MVKEGGCQVPNVLLLVVMALVVPFALLLEAHGQQALVVQAHEQVVLVVLHLRKPP